MTDADLALSWKLAAETVQRAFDRLQGAAEVVCREAESVHYMGRMEVSVEAIHALRAAALIDGKVASEEHT